MFPRKRVIFPIAKRNFASYFQGALGYLFIVVFVSCGGWMAFESGFFQSNEPNMDQLTQYFPVLLLLFIPAITMTAWADERNKGTDELLFTLPATDVEILLGKFLAVLGVYTVALLFSITHIFVLIYLGNPDWGLVVATYFGYWIAGASLLSAGMLASILTQSMTVAYVLGIVLCGIPVFLGLIGGFLSLEAILGPFSMQEQFKDLGMGIVPLSSITYFLSFTILCLYLNHVLMTKRHWQGEDRLGSSLRYVARSIAVCTILICVTIWSAHWAFRGDTTSERLFSLSKTSYDMLSSLDASDRPIEIQAFISKEVPQDYVETKKRLVGMLRQFDEMAGSSLEVQQIEVDAFSKEAEQAEFFGIEPLPFTDEDGTRTDIYLGIVIVSSFDKVVVPFFGKALPIEYELTRSVQTVANKERLKVGVLNTDAQLMSGGREWQIVSELKKQYEVEAVGPAELEGETDFDVLIAAMPSSLTTPEMASLVAHVNSGNPVLIFDDPFPLSFQTQMGVTNAPRQQKPSPGGGMGGMMGGGQQPPPPKADGGRATSLLDAIGLRWKYDRIAFHLNNPHSNFAGLPPEYVFITRGEEDTTSFNPSSAVTKNLQEIVALYTGTVSDRDLDDDLKVISLLQTSEKSGLLDWAEFVDEPRQQFPGMQMGARQRSPDAIFHTVDESTHAIAAFVDGKNGDNDVRAIYVADLDMISDFFFQERAFGSLDFEFDNVTFVLNAVDMLAENESYISLRSRRATHRTLQLVEEQKEVFLTAATKEREKADEEADAELDKAREKLQKRSKEIQENDALDEIAKTQMLRQAQISEQQRLSLQEAQIEQDKNRRIREIQADTKRKVQALESSIRFWAVVLPPLPALALGIYVFFMRISAENESVPGSRRRQA